jgi:LEA14-like dessication related protein
VIGSSPTDDADEVVFVQVTNPASRPMKLTKLEYTFAADGGATVSQGELELSRDVPAGAAVVVEVPMENPASGPVTLTGTLTAQLDQIIQSFQVSAKIQPR